MGGWMGSVQVRDAPSSRMPGDGGLERETLPPSPRASLDDADDEEAGG